jgi:arsenate reductase
MAEGWARYLHGDWFEPYSAGIEVHGLNPYAVTVMAEAGVDISHHQSQLVDDLKQDYFDLVVTVCSHADENCPYFSGSIPKIHYGFDDPPECARGMSSDEDILDCYRRVRDEIRDFVMDLKTGF